MATFPRKVPGIAYRIPGMGEPGGLLSMGLHRVGHNRSDLAAAAAFLGYICFIQLFLPACWILLLAPPSLSPSPL